ncbi:MULTISPECIES: C40 family peptidase [unclassified Luteococcus]|uniref:C40 family peptidase n=1 Tax=unclassified Luteococcus TaxID=2639923 RepID=UPI00313F14B3
MTKLRNTVLAASATAAVGFSTFAVAAPAEAANCSSTAKNVYCSMQNARKITKNVSYGQSGSSVRYLQLALNQVGYKVQVTGYFGGQTNSQLRNYQASRGLGRVSRLDPRTLHALRKGAGAKVTTSPKRSVTSSYTGSSAKGSRAVSFAYAQIGKPYRYGATGPSSYDCSGLTGAAWRSAGKSIPRTSYAQLSGLKRVSKSSLRPGDIVGFYGGGHVGLYVGNGKVIHAPRTGQNVKVASVNSMPFAGAVRPA